MGVEFDTAGITELSREIFRESQRQNCLRHFRSNFLLMVLEAISAP